MFKLCFDILFHKSICTEGRGKPFFGGLYCKVLHSWYVNIWCGIKKLPLKLHSLRSLPGVGADCSFNRDPCCWLRTQPPSKWHLNKLHSFSVWTRVKLTSVIRKPDTAVAACHLVFSLMAPVSSAASWYQCVPIIHSSVSVSGRSLYTWQIIVGV